MAPGGGNAKSAGRAPSGRAIESATAQCRPQPVTNSVLGAVLDVQASSVRAAPRFILSQIEPAGSIIFDYGPRTVVHEGAPEAGSSPPFGMLPRNSAQHLKRRSLSGHGR